MPRRREATARAGRQRRASAGPASFGSVARLGVLLALPGLAPANAAPTRPALPRYDIVGLCETGLGGMRGRILREMCVRPERDAYADLARRWSAIPAQARNRCIAVQASLQRTYGGSGSYQGLQTCLDQTPQAVDEVPPTEQRTTRPARQP